jgi:hypothetical protein
MPGSESKNAIHEPMEMPVCLETHKAAQRIYALNLMVTGPLRSRLGVRSACRRGEINSSMFRYRLLVEALPDLPDGIVLDGRSSR